MRISILTCVLGEPEALIQTLESLRPLLSPDISWTLKFASSSSKSFISQFEIEYVFCHQQDDRSIYQAMNQGIEIMESDYYFVIGAGDEVDAAGLAEALFALKNKETTTALFAPILWREHGTVWTPNPSELPVRMACPHPGAILRVDYSKAIGGFDAGYRIAADYDHLSRYVRQYGFGKTLSASLVTFAGGGMSEVRAFEGTLEEELIRMRVWKSHEYAVQARLLRRTASIASSLFDQVARLHAAS